MLCHSKNVNLHIYITAFIKMLGLVLPCQHVLRASCSGREEAAALREQKSPLRCCSEMLFLGGCAFPIIFLTRQFLCACFRPKTGFQMWLEENRANILTDNPDLNEAEVIKEGMSRFRMLTSEERMVRKHSLILWV